MKKVLLITVLALAVLCAACAADQGEGPILTGDATTITQVKVFYLGEGKLAFDAEKDSEQINKLVEQLNKISTAASTEPMDGEAFTQPKYIIDVVYADGSIDEIYSNENGDFFFRIIDADDNYFGGENSKINNILEDYKQYIEK